MHVTLFCKWEDTHTHTRARTHTHAHTLVDLPTIDMFNYTPPWYLNHTECTPASISFRSASDPLHLRPNQQHQVLYLAPALAETWWLASHRPNRPSSRDFISGTRWWESRPKMLEVTRDAVHIDNLLRRNSCHHILVVTSVTFNTRRSHPDLVSSTVRVVHFRFYVLTAPFSTNLTAYL